MNSKKLLHGVLIATIHEVSRLHMGCGIPFLGKASDDPQRVWNTLLYRLKGYCAFSSKLSPYRIYATVDLDQTRVARTQENGKPTKLRWDQTFQIYCAHEVSEIIFAVKDENPVSATLIGRAYLSIDDDILRGIRIDRWLDLFDEFRKPIRSKIHVNVQFLDVRCDPNWSQGMKPPRFGQVPSTFFKQRHGCKISLYQDAHVSNNFIPPLILDGGGVYEPQRCWEDVFDAIVNAKHLIYIAGWSVYTKIHLIRDPERPKVPHELANLNLGDLLIRKANEDGMRVLILVWDDITSKKLAHKEVGLMGTHDEDTIAYFNSSKVICRRCPRQFDKGKSIIQGLETNAVLTHHQKTIVVDRENPGTGTRGLMSFVGGIDLCDGRFDTQDHSLFKTLNTYHSDDFHQPNFSGSSIKKGGPREPWHDIHCRIEGPAAWDVLYNFEQRWKRQVGDKYLYSINELQMIVSTPEPITSKEDPETWDVQIFRSIDAGSVVDFPRTSHEAKLRGLVLEKDSTIDRSIQDAYINAIRRAKNFIYIENQYFLGSCYGWKTDTDVGALHLIPKELSLKIVSKIEAGERFSVYVVIPMWPEGEPESGPVQAILYWQRLTMEMMYTDIANAIQRKQINAHPRDYLSFYCLGNREVLKPNEYSPLDKPDPDSDYSRAQLHRRFMIYVHAKMMIVDDEYIIIGSANINERSMDGGRDTEIAMGGYQPQHILSTGKPARGQIYGFRMALWYEHLHQFEEWFRHPETVECMHAVNRIAEEHWKLYSNDAFNQDLPGHLLQYPLQIDPYGHITTLSYADFFPDTNASVLGEKSTILPPILTT